MLTAKSQEYGHPIWLISDEPYREIVYQADPLPWVPSYYTNTLVCYSYSKSLSLPGQRIGYVLVPRTAEDFDLVYAAVCGAGRALGYVCAWWWPTAPARPQTSPCTGRTGTCS